MSFEFNYLKEKTEKSLDSKKSPEKKDENYELLVDSIMQFQRMRQSNSLENQTFVEDVEKKVFELSGSARINIFEKIMELKKENKEDWKDVDLWEEGINNSIYENNYSDETLLIDVDENTLANLLKPLNKELRENIYVTRDKKTIGDIIKISEKRAEEDKIVYHVSPYELNDSVKPGKGEEYIYFSSDIEKLFNLNEAKYIYAFRINNKLLNNSKYCTAECFHRLRNVDSNNFFIDDSIKIFDEKDPSYRKQVLDSLGAKFYKDYLSNNSHGEEAMKNFSDDRFAV
ncbi:MAG: hypothetical protein PF488_03560 [Patescibacteria group bacterium]|jgi:hypothetical protein|nr:hypothetical protein [Patescibacteria group bacterium]